VQNAPCSDGAHGRWLVSRVGLRRVPAQSVRRLMLNDSNAPSGGQRTRSRCQVRLGSRCRRRR
jgi:hypothetical protein